MPGIVKLERAEAQLGVLYDGMMDTLNDQPVMGEIDDEPYPGLAGAIAYSLVIIAAPSFSRDVGILIGEILHNFRGALDHAVWSLVHRHGTKNLPAKKQLLVQFPLSSTKKAFDDWLPGRLPGVPVAPYHAIFERYQPYKRSIEGEPMKHLRILTDLDKHRILLPVAALPGKGDLNFGYKHAQFVRFTPNVSPGRPIKPGTKVMTLVLTNVVKGKTEVSVSGVVTSEPIFPRSVLRPPKRWAAVNVEGCLNDIQRACRGVLEQLWAVM